MLKNAPEKPPHAMPDNLRRHWLRTRRLTICLLTMWFLVAFCVVFFARELSGLRLFGWPLSFYLAAQGSVLINVVIVAFYAWRMGCIDRQIKDE